MAGKTRELPTEPEEELEEQEPADYRAARAALDADRKAVAAEREVSRKERFQLRLEQEAARHNIAVEDLQKAYDTLPEEQRLVGWLPELASRLDEKKKFAGLEAKLAAYETAPPPLRTPAPAGGGVSTPDADFIKQYADASGGMDTSSEEHLKRAFGIARKMGVRP